jgi:hypothetical protein
VKPVVILGGSFLLWITLRRDPSGKSRLNMYADLARKKTATASNSPTSFNATGAAPSTPLDGAATAGQELLDKAYSGITI